MKDEHNDHNKEEYEKEYRQYELTYIIILTIAVIIGWVISSDQVVNFIGHICQVNAYIYLFGTIIATVVLTTIIVRIMSLVLKFFARRWYKKRKKINKKDRR